MKTKRKGKDYASQHQFEEKLSITLGCLGPQQHAEA